MTKRYQRQIEFEAFFDAKKELTVEDAMRLMGVGWPIIRATVHAIRERKVNPRQIESVHYDGYKRIYREISHDSSNNDIKKTGRGRIRNGLTELKNHRRIMTEFVKKNPKLAIELYLEDQRMIMEAIAVH